MDYFIEFYRNINRQGPGDDKYTLMALEMLDLPAKPKILDVGCGCGKQTIALAKAIDCEIVALDYYQCFLDELDETIKKENLGHKIKTVQGSMSELPFSEGEFDLIWSEGAIYIMGFEKGLREWKKFLKPDGKIVASEITWLRKDVPTELEDFWTAEYAEMGLVSDKVRVVENLGYQCIGTLTLPEYGWLKNYYAPLEKKKVEYLEKYGDVKEAREVAEVELDKEINLYKKYKDYYGYVFYVMKKLNL